MDHVFQTQKWIKKCFKEIDSAMDVYISSVDGAHVPLPKSNFLKV